MQQLPTGMLCYATSPVTSCCMYAVMRMQAHPTGTGLTLQQKKSKLWGSKAAAADPAQVIPNISMHNPYPWWPPSLK